MHTLAPDKVFEPASEMYRAGPPTPGARLLAAISLIRPGRVAADIGCDHGKLAAYLALHKIASKVIAVDRRPLPLARARALAMQTGCAGQVDCRLGDGLFPLAPFEAEEIVMAGMSGETLIEIIGEVDWVRDERVHFVLVPATRPHRLRRWLCEQGFSIQKEVPVEDRGRYYSVMSVGYTGECVRPTPLFCEVGLLPQTGGPEAKALLAMRLTDLNNQKKANLPVPERKALEQLIQEVTECQKSMKLPDL